MSSKKIFIVSLLMTIVVGFFVVANLAQAADDYGLSATAGAAGLTKTMSGDFPTIVGNLLGTALSFIGVLFFALMVFGGFMWMTARGNEEQTKKALSTITAAVIGLVIVLSSYTITSFVFKSAGVQSGGTATAGQTQSTVGTDTWCGRTDVELLSTFEIPSGWTSYKCMDVIVSAEEEATYCKDGKLYADKNVNKCPGSQKCCDSTKVPEGYGKFCLVKAEVDQTPTCEKIGLDFNQEKVCVGKYDTKSACDSAVADGVGTTKGDSAQCGSTSECSTGLICRHELGDDEKTVAEITRCLKALNTNEGPCVNAANDCATENSFCGQEKSGSSLKVCKVLGVVNDFCVEDSYCETNLKCKDDKCQPRAVGDSCQKTSDCQATNKTQVCVSGKCKDGSNGITCGSDNECASGVCLDIDGDGKAWKVCGVPQATGKECERGVECQSGTCKSDGKCS